MPTRARCVQGFVLAISIFSTIGSTPAQAAEKQPLKANALKSNIVLVVDQDTGEALISKNADVRVPIASLTKLMTALVVTDAQLSMDEILEISSEDIDREKNTHSRLTVGTKLSRGKLMLLALMSSENRAAMALSRGYPGGRKAFVAQMNAKARSLQMSSTQFTDPAGLSSQNVSTARDLLRLISAADSEALIRRYSTQSESTVLVRGRPTKFVNTNHMVRTARDWDIKLQKTGFTNEAGRCLVMRATTLNRKLSMVFLNSFGKLTRFADAARVRQQLEKQAKGGRSQKKIKSAARARRSSSKATEAAASTATSS